MIAVLFELFQRPGAHSRDRQYVGVAGGIQVDWDEHILLEPGKLCVVNVLVDLSMEHCERFVRTVLEKFAEHAWPHTRNELDFLVAGRVQIDVHEHAVVHQSRTPRTRSAVDRCTEATKVEAAMPQRSSCRATSVPPSFGDGVT